MGVDGHQTVNRNGEKGMDNHFYKKSVVDPNMGGKGQTQR